jgi:phospholipid/cholesterol/gamma-HCH transport system substrate-binding protein
MKTTTPAAKNSRVKLGIFVSVTLVLFIVGIYFVGQRQKLFSTTFRLSGIFQDIGGLQVGNNVRFSGINVGIVDGIQQVTDSTVRVDMLVVEDTRKFIKKNAIAIIGSDGLMGSKLVMLLPGTTGKKVLMDMDTIATSQSVNVDEILSSLKVTATNAALITTDLSIVMQSIREGKGTLGKLLMDSVMAENVGTALFNIKQGAGGFKQNMDAAGKSFLLRGALKKNEKEKEKVKDDKEKEKAKEKENQ